MSTNKSKEEIMKSIEERLVYYIDKLPDLETLGNNILEVIKRKGIGCDDVTSGQLLLAYTRLMESHERILALATNLFEKSFYREFLSEEERSFLSIFAKMSSKEKEIFFINSIKRASY